MIIPNWNGRDLLGPCLDSVFRQEFTDFEVIVIDNGSSDDSVAFVHERFPQVTIIPLEENRGFSEAVNSGIAASTSPYVCLLNNDTEVDPSWLGAIVTALEANPQAGSAASKILFHSDPETVNSAGDEFSLFGVAYQRRLTQGDAALFTDERYVFSACAAAALYRRELFEQVGLFDEFFFAYQEDVDLGFRAQLVGYLCLFVPGAIVYHKYHQTSVKIADFCAYLKERNKYFVLIKNLPLRILVLCLPLFVFYEVFAFMLAVKSRHVHAYCKARWDAWRYLPRILKSRRQIQRQRLVGDKDLLRIMKFREPVRILFYRPARTFFLRLQALLGRPGSMNISKRMEN